MAFQFRCPQGHLLQGEESQIGQQSECPFCHTQFLVPAPPGGLPDKSFQPAAPPAAQQGPINEQPPEQLDDELPTEWQPGLSVGESIGRSLGEDAPQVSENLFQQPGAEQRNIFHIPCPKGHVLETPREMLGQYAQCPYCRAEFKLLLQDSQEYQAEIEKKQERREQKLGKLWMNWAIAAALVVVFGVVIMIAVAVSR